jgi:uncharacterized protein YjbI with pentapeptide repeats
MNSKLNIDEIENVLTRPELTSKEIASILSSETIVDGKLINVNLFNSWMKRRYDYSANYHNRLVIENIELSNVNLSNLDMRYSELRNSAFKGCNLTGASFWDSTIEGCKFWGSDFSSANLRGSSISNTKLESIRLSGQVCFIETKLSDVVLSFNKSELVELDFSLASLANIIITVPTSNVIDGHLTSINPVGLGKGKAIADIGLHSLNLSYAVVEQMKLVNIRIFNLIAEHASLNNLDIINSRVTNKLRIGGVKLYQVRAKESFFNVYFEEQSKLIATQKIEESDHETIATLRDNFKSVNNSAATRKYNILEKDALRSRVFSGLKSGPIHQRMRDIGSYGILSLIS